MRLLDQLESRFGRFAIPGLVQIIALLQLLTFFMFILMPPEAGAKYQAFLVLDVDRVLQGQVWRLLTYIFVPGTSNILFAIIGAMFLRWLGNGLEQAWGAFRLTLYFVGGMLAVSLGALLFGYSATGTFLFQSLLLAFAMFYPNEEILLYFILPLKIKLIAWLDVAVVVLLVLGNPSAFWPVLFAHLNFLVAFGPGFIQGTKQRAKVAGRRAAFDRAADTGAAFFHQCVVCQKTEVDDPKLEFRVNADGDEVCSDCRAKAQSAV